jgi:hypothetical protein
MEVIDYNGTGFWSVEEVRARYPDYARRFQITEPRTLSPLVHSNGDKQWIYSVMDIVIEGIEDGDLACAELGIEFIEEDQLFAFGRILKSNTARALRRASLTDEQKERIRKRVVEMLGRRYLPREYRQYAKSCAEDWIGKLVVANRRASRKSGGKALLHLLERACFPRRRAEQGLAADGAIACFSSSLVPSA